MSELPGTQQVGGRLYPAPREAPQRGLLRSRDFQWRDYTPVLDDPPDTPPTISSSSGRVLHVGALVIVTGVMLFSTGGAGTDRIYVSLPVRPAGTGDVGVRIGTGDMHDAVSRRIFHAYRRAGSAGFFDSDINPLDSKDIDAGDVLRWHLTYEATTA